MTPTNTTTLTPAVRELVVRFRPYLDKRVFEVDEQYHNNPADARTYAVKKIDILQRVTVTPNGDSLPNLSENAERVTITFDTDGGHRFSLDATKFEDRLCSREKALARLDKLISRAQAIENESLLERWQGFKQQIEQDGADALFC